METILEVNELFGGYLLHKPILRNISFTVGKGEMVGLIGLNGAGKSTTIKHILGLLHPQQGTIRICQQELAVHPQSYRSAFGYVPESPELYDELTVQEHLELTAMAYGVGKEAFKQRTSHLMELFRMQDKRNAFANHLSKGMRQKVMLMNAFLIEPPLYIIDEPFLGLDPLSMRSLLNLMLTFKRQGASFLISSHILSTIEKYCDRFLVLHHGEIVAEGTLQQIAETAGNPGATLDDAFLALVKEG